MTTETVHLHCSFCRCLVTQEEADRADDIFPDANTLCPACAESLASGEEVFWGDAGIQDGVIDGHGDNFKLCRKGRTSYSYTPATRTIWLNGFPRCSDLATTESEHPIPDNDNADWEQWARDVIDDAPEFNW